MQALLEKLTVALGMCLVFGLAVLPMDNVLFAKVKVEPPAKRAKEAPKAKTHHVKVKIEGMTCGGCVHRITTALKGVKGVVSSSVSLDKGSADVVCAKGLKAATVVARIKKLGYKVSLVPAKVAAKAGKGAKKGAKKKACGAGCKCKSCLKKKTAKAAKKGAKKGAKKKACGVGCKCKSCLKKKAAKNQG